MYIKQYLFLFFLIAGISCTLFCSSPNYTVIPKKQSNLELKKINEHIESYQKEIRYYGSDSPVVTSSHISLAIIVLSLFGLAYASTQTDDKKIMYEIATASGAGMIIGMGIHVGSNISSERAFTRLLNNHERIIKEKNKILIILLTKEDPTI